MSSSIGRQKFIRENLRDLAAAATLVGLGLNIANHCGGEDLETRSDEDATDGVQRVDLRGPQGEDVTSALSFLGLNISVASFFATPGHRLYMPNVHPADREALDFVAGAAGLAASVREGRNITDNLIRPTFEGTQIIFGGVNSQPWARVIFEYEGSDEDHLKRRADAVIPIPYIGLADAEEVPLVDRRDRLGGELTRRPMWQFVGPKKEVGKPRFVDGYRVLEWLSIVKLRNFLSPIWSKDGSGYIVHVDGASGVGTRGVKLIFDRRTVEALEAKLGAANEFQVLLPIGVAYDEGGMLPHQILLDQVESVPLAVTNDMYHEARARIGQAAGRYIAGFQV